MLFVCFAWQQLIGTKYKSATQIQILARSVALLLNFHFLIAKFFVNVYEDIILKCSEIFSDR